MKKIFTLVVALCTLTAVHATYYLHESFEQAEGPLTNIGLDNDNLTDWMFKSDVNKPITMNVVDGNMTLTGYASTAKGGKLEVGTNPDGSRLAYRNLVPAGLEIKSGSIFVSAIINVDSLHLLTNADASVSTYGGYLFALGDVWNQYSRLYVRSVMNAAGDAATGFQLGVAKMNESLEDFAMADDTFNKGENVLVVVEYVFNAGEADDSVNLYINPTSAKPQPSAICVNSTKYDTQNGISKLFIAESTCQQGRLFVDEIKVTNDWATLFNESATVDKIPVLTVTPAYPSFTENDKPMEVDSTYTTTITITGQNLTGDVTLSSTRPEELTFSKTTLTKAEIEADGGVEVVLTAKPTAIAAYEQVNISLTDADNNVLKAISITWTAIKPFICKTIAELNAAMEDATGEAALTLNFTGEAIVTHSFVVPSLWGMPNSMVILQDATGACLMDRSSAFYDYDDAWNEIDLLPVGAKVTGLDLTDYTNGEILFLMPNQSSQQDNFEALGTGEITPQVVTSAELINHPFELVTLQNVTFAPEATVTKFDIENKEADANGLGTAVLVDLKQGETVITASVDAALVWPDDPSAEEQVPASNLIGTTIPTDPADVTGIVWTADEIRLRSTDDIKAATTGINNAALSSEEGIEKFVRDGQLIIRMNGVEYNVLGAKLQ